jgi:hypothetical protein
VVNHRGPKIRNRNGTWYWVLIISIAFTAAYFVVSEDGFSSDILAALLGSVFASAFFFYKSHADDAKFMHKLFTEFNGRYDKLNNQILEILEKPDAPLAQDEKLVLVDNFNLCAEEWFFYRLGYIHEPVWKSWHNGMKQFGANEYIAKLWHEESKTDSYYGFLFPVSPQVIAL